MQVIATYLIFQVNPQSTLFDVYCLSAMGFPTGSAGKEFTCNAGDPGIEPGKIPWRRKWQLQYSCLENSMDRGAKEATVHGIAKKWTVWLTFTFFLLPLSAQWGFKGQWKFLSLRCLTSPSGNHESNPAWRPLRCLWWPSLSCPRNRPWDKDSSGTSLFGRWCQETWLQGRVRQKWAGRWHSALKVTAGDIWTPFSQGNCRTHWRAYALENILHYYPDLRVRDLGYLSSVSCPSLVKGYFWGYLTFCISSWLCTPAQGTPATRKNLW